MHVNRDAERTADSPIGQRHTSTVTVREFERQLGFASWIGYTHHHATALLLRDTVPDPHDAAWPSDASLYASPSDQIRVTFLSWSRVDVRPLSGADRSGLRS